MGLFITVKIHEDKCKNACKACADVCPVDIFKLADGKLSVVADNEDECTLCELCLQRCPSGSIEIIKNY